MSGRRVLDLGSGEGFGASILAETATEVVGLDIDERAVEHSRLNWGTSASPSLRGVRPTCRRWTTTPSTRWWRSR